MASLEAVQAVAKPFLQVISGGREDAPRVSDEALQDAIQRLGSRGKALYRATPLEDEDRSDRLYELAALASEHGVDEETTFCLLRASPWNKFEGRDDEVLRLWEAIERSRESLPNGERGSLRVRRPVTRARSIGTLLARDTPAPQWLVEGIWEDKGWGFIAGEPKTYKSTFATDLAVSIATATPFLGHFNVLKPGPVLIVQEENTEGVSHGRLARILRHKERGGEIHSVDGSIMEVTLPDGDCPVYCLDRTHFSFNNTKKRRALEADIKALQPQLVIFDPLQRMMGDLSVRDEKDVTKCLDWLDKVVDNYNTGVMIVHHYHKGREGGPKLGGQRMLGSQALHAWLTCGLYIEREGEEGGGSLKVTREFRAFDSGSPFELEFDSQDDEDFYSVHVTIPEKKVKKTTEKQDALLDLIAEQPWQSAAEYASTMGISRRVMATRLKKLECPQKKRRNPDGGAPTRVYGSPSKRDSKT